MGAGSSSSPICKPFEWVSFEKRATPEAVEALSVRFLPRLRLDFQTSPSDFYWMRLRRRIVDSLPWGKEDGLSIMLFIVLWWTWKMGWIEPHSVGG